jgi:uncharacterized membrane protein
MNQPVGRAHRADNQAADQAVQESAAERPGQPGTHTQEPQETQRLWTLFQIDQQRISALDTIAMTIRGWTVTLVSAIVGFSLSQHHRNLLPVAIVGTVLFMMLDVGYRSTQLRHVDRVGKVEQEIASGYRLRSRDPGGPQWLKSLRSRIGWNRYGSPVLFYVTMLLLLLLLWIVTK